MNCEKFDLLQGFKHTLLLSLFSRYSVTNLHKEAATTSFYNASVWFHVVLNFSGPDEGIKVYHDSHQVASSSPNNLSSAPHEEGLIVIGKINTNNIYNVTRSASVRIDEMLLFNQRLSEEQISILSNTKL